MWDFLVGWLVWFVLSAPVVRSLLNAMANSDISASEEMLKNLGMPQRRAMRMTVDLERSKKGRKLYQWVYAEPAQRKLCWRCIQINETKALFCLPVQEEQQLTQDSPYQAEIQSFSYLRWKLWFSEEITGVTPRGVCSSEDQKLGMHCSHCRVAHAGHRQGTARHPGLTFVLQQYWRQDSCS